LQRAVEIEAIAIASAHSLGLDIAFRLQFGEDHSNRTLGDPDRMRNLYPSAVGLSAKVREHQCMIRKKTPRRHDTSPCLVSARAAAEASATYHWRSLK